MEDINKIPLIDISNIKTKKGRISIANDIHNACKNIGFFYIINHGISLEIQNNIEKLSKEFFSLPLQEKMEIDMKKGGISWRGYFSVGGEYTSGRIDQKEGIYFGIEHENDNIHVINKQPTHGLNQWPNKPKEMKQVVRNYIKQLTELADLLLNCIAIGLGLPELYFKQRFTNNPTVLFRIFNYPVHLFEEGDDEWGVRQHTDMGFLTILKQDNSGGLEVRNKIGKWIEATPIDNSFVVNIGDMLELWTHGLYKATLHRVRNKSNNDRLSFPLFFDPNWSTSLEPIDKQLLNMNESILTSTDRWDKLDLQSISGQTYGEFVWNKISKVFPHLANDSKNILDI